MSWSWIFEDADGTEVGRSQLFESRGDAESWVGEAFGDLVEEGVDQVRLLEGDVEVYGPMSLHP
ncbi:hypothetical protein [Aeromicrobium sp. CTD01-1L150]|uniref:hypothetical protein n=1 Tax=Aeromicrobium sp. CTD01-1L150 TaxID=3341830 RepID=UPI0035BFBC1A